MGIIGRRPCWSRAVSETPSRAELLEFLSTADFFAGLDFFPCSRVLKNNSSFRLV